MTPSPTAEGGELVARLRSMTFLPCRELHYQAADRLAAQQREIEGLRAAVLVGLDDRATSKLAAAEAKAEALEKERDEADRRAGAAERRLEQLEEEGRKRRYWMDERKAEVGIGRNRPFDDAWKDLVARATKAEAEVAELRARVAELEAGLDGALQVINPLADDIATAEMHAAQIPTTSGGR